MSTSSQPNFNNSNPNVNNNSNNNNSSNTVNNVSSNTKLTNKDRVTLVVDETPFVVDSKIFNAHQNTLLGRMFSNKNFELKANARGEYDIGRGTCLTSSVFRLILVSNIL